MSKLSVTLIAVPRFFFCSAPLFYIPGCERDGLKTHSSLFRTWKVSFPNGPATARQLGLLAWLHLRARDSFLKWVTTAVFHRV